MPAEEALPVKRPSGKNAAVTMRDVATQSGFSPATVSIVLNNAPLGAVHRAGNEKTHRRSGAEAGLPARTLMARFLRSKRTHSVGRIVFRHHRSLLHAGHARH